VGGMKPSSRSSGLRTIDWRIFRQQAKFKLLGGFLKLQRGVAEYADNATIQKPL